jgi:hypothetical protein
MTGSDSSDVRRAGFADSGAESEADSGTSGSRLDERPEDAAPSPERRTSSPSGREKGSLVARAGEALASRGTDASFTDENWLRTSTETGADLSAARGTETALLNQRALALALTGLVGTFHVVKAEEPARRRKQPGLVDRS